LAAAFFVLLEIGTVAVVCTLLRLPVTGLRIIEAVSVTLVITTFLVAIGNLSSLHNPRGVNPVKSLRTAAGARVQAMLMLLFPVTLAPVALAYLARYAFDSEWAFFGVLLFAAVLGGLAYYFSMESAVKTAARRTEQIIAALSQGEGLIQS
jgi:ABC-2 type transport system permease protein